MSAIIWDEETRQFSVVGDRVFGAKSKLLALVNPGAWNSKEAAKYAYDNEEDYKRNRARHAWHGAFAPVQASYKLKKAKEMHRQGKSAAEIRDMIDRHTGGTAAAEYLVNGVANIATGGVYGAALNAGSTVHGLSHAFDKDRKKFKK